MHRTGSIIIAAACYALGCFIAPHLSSAQNASSAGSRTQPNIIVVLIDDMGWSDLSCFGGTHTKTENIDRLAAEGMRFHSYYVNAPICSPSRTALSTGMYPHRFRITSYLAERQLNDERGTAQWLDPSAPMLARALQKSGYATGHFGKWHMGGQRDVGEAPFIQEYGFDRSLTNFEGLGPRVLPLCDTFDGKPTKKHDLGSGSLGRGPIEWLERSKITTAYCDAALRFIDDSITAGKPFYINLWPDDVHSPFFPSEEGRSKAGDKKRRCALPVFSKMNFNANKDRRASARRFRLRDNTILVMSDNGHEAGAGMSSRSAAARRGCTKGHPISADRLGAQSSIAIG
ncbi:MAG: sulfatase-like hydrolase/transferase [Pirellulales bacterium]